MNVETACHVILGDELAHAIIGSMRVRVHQSHKRRSGVAMPFDAAPAEVELDDPVARVLLRAAEIIEERGWCQGSPQDSEGRVCIAGAVKLAAGMSELDGWSDLATRAGYRLERVHGVLPWWNDTPGRTASEVISALRRAAAVPSGSAEGE